MFRNAYLLLTLTTLFWAANAVAGKLAVGHVAPMMLNSLRWLVAAVVLIVLFHRRIAADFAILRANAMLLLVLGGFGFTGFSIALYSAVTYTSAINVSIEQASMPLAVFVFSFLLFRTRVIPAQIVGFLLSVSGVALTVSHGDPSRLADLDLNVGDLLMLVGVLCYGGYTAALRLKPAMAWQSLLFALVTAGFITSIPFVLWEVGTGRGGMPTPWGWAIVAFTALFPSLAAQAFYIKGVELIGANRAGLFINLVPIFGTLLSVMVLGETLHLYHAAAIVLVLGGIWLAEHSGRRRALSP